MPHERFPQVEEAGRRLRPLRSIVISRAADASQIRVQVVDVAIRRHHLGGDPSEMLLHVIINPLTVLFPELVEPVYLQQAIVQRQAEAEGVTNMVGVCEQNRHLEDPESLIVS